MPEFKAKNRSITSELGHLVICWNDLELEIRVLLLTLASDAATAEVLSSELEIVAVFSAVRKLANQYDAFRRRLNTRLTIEADTQKKRVKLYEQAAPRIHHLIDCAARLHEYKNWYVQEMHSSQKRYEAAKDQIITRTQLESPWNSGIVDDLKHLTSDITTLTKYAVALISCIRKNGSRNSRAHLVWPAEPPLPEQLQETRAPNPRNITKSQAG